MFGIIIIFLIISSTILLYKIQVLFKSSLFVSLGQCSLFVSLGQCSLVSLGQSSLVSLGYNIIYYYSVCQIKCNKLYNNILSYLRMFKADNNLINDIKLQTIELFDLDTNKNMIFTEEEKRIFELINSSNNLIILSSKNGIDKKIVETCEYYFDESTSHVSKISFIALYLNYNDVRYHIILKTEEFNYYLVGNIINKQFIQYYINNILNLPFYYTKETSSYKLELMDQEVNIINLNADQSIIIEKDNYRIIEKGKEKEKKE